MSFTPVGSSFTFISCDSRGNTVTSFSAGSGYLKTGATGGFLYIPQMSGAPNSTGATGYTGMVAMCFDSVNAVPWYLNSATTSNWVSGNSTGIIQRVVSPGSASVTFSNIPPIYNHLMVMLTSATVAASTLNVQVNGISTSTYKYQRIAFNGSTNISLTSTTTAWPIGVEDTSTTNAVSAIFYIPFYRSTTLLKTCISFSGCMGSTNVGGYYVYGVNGASTAVSSLTVFSGSNFVTGSEFILYGMF